MKSRGRCKAKRETPGTHVQKYLSTYNNCNGVITRTHIEKLHCALLRGNVWHGRVHCSKERVTLSGKSVIAVGTRCTDVRAYELLMVRGCCVPYVE